MASTRPLSRPQALSPDDLRLAAGAFEEALASLPAEAADLQPYTARQLVARYVIETALGGLRDPILLRDGALEFVTLAAARQSVRSR
jgi:hypothetical protein